MLLIQFLSPITVTTLEKMSLKPQKLFSVGNEISFFFFFFSFFLLDSYTLWRLVVLDCMCVWG